MMRSLFSGVSGLRNHQSAMDVIGANISNVNTVGYKGGRSNFSDVISQTLQGAASATTNRGGTNPIQIGLGMGLNSVDTLFTGGSFQPTGKQTDLAISGQGFFILADGSNSYYTRAGNFDFDSLGNYLVPGTGMRVQGWQAVNGVINTTGPITNIQVPIGTTMPALATTTVNFANNLSGDQTPGHAVTTSITVYDSLGNPQSLSQKFMKSDITTDTWIARAALADTSIPMTNPLTEIVFDTSGLNPAVQQVIPSNTDVAITSMRMSTAAGTISVPFTMYDSTGLSHDYVMRVASPIGAGTEYNIYDATDTTFATSLGNGDITWNAGTSNYTFTPVTQFVFDSNNISFTNPPGKGTAATASAAIASYAGAGTSVISIPNVQLDNTSGSIHDAFYTVFDAQLNPHSLKMTFTQTSNNSWTYKIVEAGITSPSTLGSGVVTYTAPNYVFTPTLSSLDITVGSGATAQKMTMSFTASLPPAGNSFLADCTPNYSTLPTASPVTFTPPGAAQSSVTLNVSAITQYGGESTVQAANQNGYTSGSLQTTTIDTSGILVGKFSNGQTQNLAQVALATFNNPGGLTRVGDTLFATSNNSGVAQTGTSGSGGRGTISPGTLEMSNVDLADQFSKMIITQRGFQANSKIISVTDEMLQELANLKR